MNYHHHKLTKSLPVDDNLNYWDALCKRLIRQGLTAKAVARITGLQTVGRVAYCKQKMGLIGQTSAYRNGTSPEAREAIADVESQLLRVHFMNKNIQDALKTPLSKKVR